MYDDFLNYGSGVYSHVSGELVGKHAVNVIGYGVESGIKYYLAANQWSDTWGEGGFFKIKVGECEFDTSGYGCDA